MAAIAPWAIQKADVAYVVQGPATLGLPATILKWFRSIPFVYNIQDLWPDSLLSTGMFEGGLKFKVLHGWCNYVYRRASKITVIAPGMKTRLIERGVPADKIDVAYNWCDDSLICRTQPDQNLLKQLGFEGKFNIVFAGNMGKAQALEAVIAAASLTQKSCPHVQFVFIGSGIEVDNLKQLSQQNNLKNVLFLPRRPVHEIGTILNLADVLLVHLRRDPLFAITIPSKTQAYLAMGRPILMAVEGDAADLVQKAQAGLTCLPESPEAIAEAAQKLYTMPRQQREQYGYNGRTYYDNQLAFSHAVSRYEQLFQDIASQWKRK